MRELIFPMRTQPTCRLANPIIFLFMFTLTLHAQIPPRYSSDTKLDLCGTWTFVTQQKDTSVIEIPGFYTWEDETSPDFVHPGTPNVISTENSMEAHFLRTFDVPLSMSGKRIYLHFESVNFVSQIFIDDQYVGIHSGGYVPFEMDITSFVTPGQTDVELKVEIEHDTDYGFLLYFNQERPLWPVGYYDNYLYQGITDSVWLAARPDVYVDDIQIITSVQSGNIGVAATLVNGSSTQKAVSLDLTVENDGIPVLTVGSIPYLTIEPGETRRLPVQVASWADPVLWTPDNPHLYHLEAVVQEYPGGSPSHIRGQRFGFREFTQSGAGYYLNGTRINLRGDNIVIEASREYYQYLYPNPDNWSAIVDSMLSLNFNCIRLHHSPARRFFQDVCDEKGMMIIAESPVYARAGLILGGNATYISNSASWIRKWVRRDRNHPSIVAWSVENEMWIWGSLFMPSDLITLGTALLEEDASRPLLYEGDEDLNGLASTVSFHYIFGFNSASWPVDILNELEAEIAPYSGKPLSLSEFDWYRSSNESVTQSDRMRRQSVQTRAARITGFSDIRPYRLDWTWHPNPLYFNHHYDGQIPTADEVAFLKNSMDPVAVFDKDYFRYEFAPDRPAAVEGSAVNRTLVIFNDELTENEITVSWKTLFGENVQSFGSFRVTVLPGEREEYPFTFYAPVSLSDSDTTYYLELSSRKGDVTRFTQRLSFKSLDAGIKPPNSPSPLSVVRQGNSAEITWQPVTSDIAGNPITVTEYILYTAEDINFSSGLDSITGLSGPGYTDDLSAIINDNNTHRFYRMAAVAGYGIRSEYTETIGAVTQSFVTTATTDFNTFALLMNNTGVNNAQGIINLIPGATSVAVWNGAVQGFLQYIPGLSSNNFNVGDGESFLVSITQDTSLLLIGESVSSAYTLSAGFNLIMHPFEKAHITTASALADSIPDCDGISYWDADQQVIIDYIPNVFDFPVHPGHVYYISVTTPTQWPLSGKSPVGRDGRTDTIRKFPYHCPHGVYGRLDEGISGETNNLRITAWLNNAGSTLLTSDTPWIRIVNDHWIVQCGGFTEGWEVGDTLNVRFYVNDDLVGKSHTRLTGNPLDPAESITGITYTPLIPENMQLLNAYPNPFNPETTISFGLRQAEHVRLSIYNMNGQLLRTLVNSEMEAGLYELKWRGRDESGNQLPSGTYLIQLRAGDWTGLGKCTLIK
jgi:hypothetical protein